MMDLKNKVAIVTGASGIGAETVKSLLNVGMKVVGFARRKERIENLVENHNGKLFALKVDVTKPQEILDSFAWVTDNVGPVHVLINNAGIIKKASVIEGDLETWQQIIDTNFMSIAISCKEAIKIMQERNIDGYIININSICGYYDSNDPSNIMYRSSKCALVVMTENIRVELARLNSKIKITTKILLKNGMKVVGLARRKEKVEQLCDKEPHLKKILFALKVDVTSENEIVEAFKWITQNVGPVSVLVNNAGIMKPGPVISGDSKNWRSIIDTNVMGAATASREAIEVMKKYEIHDGYIININSIAGHYILNVPGMDTTFYHASKFALTALTRSLRYELLGDSIKIRTCSVSPGLVDTEIVELALKNPEQHKQFLERNPYLLSDDIAEAIKFLLSTRPIVEITELTIRPVGEQF